MLQKIARGIVRMVAWIYHRRIIQRTFWASWVAAAAAFLVSGNLAVILIPFLVLGFWVMFALTLNWTGRWFAWHVSRKGAHRG